MDLWIKSSLKMSFRIKLDLNIYSLWNYTMLFCSVLTVILCCLCKETRVGVKICVIYRWLHYMGDGSQWENIYFMTKHWFSFGGIQHFWSYVARSATSLKQEMSFSNPGRQPKIRYNIISLPIRIPNQNILHFNIPMHNPSLPQEIQPKRNITYNFPFLFPCF